MHRRDLSDPEWAVLAPYFPATPPRPGGQWKDHRTILSGVFHRLRTGCPWRDLPGRYGPWQTVYERFYNLRRSGRLAELLAALVIAWAAIPLVLRATGLRDPSFVVLDEVAGMLAALVWVSPRPVPVLLAFVLFRLLDILKPFPIDRLERIPGAWGVLLDDLAAGLLAGFLADSIPKMW